MTPSNTPNVSSFDEGHSVQPETSLFHLGYVSTQTQALGPAGLVALLNEAREENHRLNVTGLLLHRSGCYFQILEGERSVVEALYARIQKDPRHHRVETILTGDIDTREFTDWNMGFLEMDGIDVSMLPGFTDFLSHAEEPRAFLHDVSKTQRLALLFSTLR